MIENSFRVHRQSFSTSNEKTIHVFGNKYYFPFLSLPIRKNVYSDSSIFYAHFNNRNDKRTGDVKIVNLKKMIIIQKGPTEISWNFRTIFRISQSAKESSFFAPLKRSNILKNFYLICGKITLRFFIMIMWSLRIGWWG